MTRRLAAGLATVATAGILAGCGSSDDETTTTGTSTAAETTASDAGASGGAASTGAYRDGTFSADGSYESPAGQETVGVSLTLKGGTVAAVDVTPKATHPNSKKFQGEFEDGISSEVVGKSIDSLQVSKVSGSSLTSGGFNQAVEKIKAEARG